MNAPKILILGTDAAGKNFVGQLLFKHLLTHDVDCAFRERRLSAADNRGIEKDKSTPGHLAEWAFVSCYPLLKPLMPTVVDALLRLDLARSKAGDRAEIIVSHTALRLAAFDLGHQLESVADIRVPASTATLLQRLKQQLAGDVVVLDIAHATRLKRVNARGESSDPFDRYLAARPELSERIEACMVHIACEYLEATLIVNDDLSEKELLTAVAKSSAAFAGISPS